LHRRTASALNSDVNFLRFRPMVEHSYRTRVRFLVSMETGEDHILPVIGLLLRSVDEGAAPVLWAATDPVVGRPSGAVFNRRRQRIRLNRASADAAGARLMWEESERLLKLAPWP
jgi:hypothetical protein